MKNFDMSRDETIPCRYMRNTWRIAATTITAVIGFTFSPATLNNYALAENGALNAVPTVAPAPLASTTPPVAVASTTKKISSITPYELSIPSIKLDTSVIPVGLNAKGEMDVPSGKTNNVGWYKGGAKPGAVGSAVLDAHVFAAFKNLDDVKVGDSVYVTDVHGNELHYIIEKTETLPLAQISTQKLFNRSDTARLNLITCAGKYRATMGTYDHRFIAYAVLAS